MTKNPESFYGLNYLNKVKGDTGGKTRFEDNGSNLQAALFVKRLMGTLAISGRVLDVGCGRGFVVRHLRTLGIDAEGCEYSKEACDLSVCGARQGDLTQRLPFKDGEFVLVYSLGVLSHPPEPSTDNALQELHRISSGYLWTNILTGRHHLQQHHLTVKPPAWWIPRFESAGWRIENHDKLTSEFFADYGGQWKAVWKKSKV